MTPVDLALTVAGWSYAAVSGFGREDRRARLLIAVLASMTIVPVLVVGLTPTPLERTFEELREGRYPDRTSWLRLEGELRPAADTRLASYTYVLEDPRDPGLAVTVYAAAPLPTGYRDVTGRLLGGVRLPGTFEALYADVPTEPARHDPWLLIGLPGLLAVVLAIGERIGYPVVRGERVDGPAPAPLAPKMMVPVRWSGRIGGERRIASTSVSCTIGVTGEGDASTVILTEDGAVRSFGILRGGSKIVGRVCRVGGCLPGIEIHAPRADVILEFETIHDRDRVVASLG